MQNTLSLEQKYQELQAQNARLQALLAEKEQKIDYLQERLNILLSKRYKAQSEQLKSLQGQLFDEAELEAAIRDMQQEIEALGGAGADGAEEAEGTAKTKNSTQRTTPKRNPLPAHLRRVEITVDASDEDQQAMGDDWACVGFEISEQLAVQQREYYVKVIKRKKYVRKAPPAEGEDVPPRAQAGILVAPPAKVILPRAIADATLLADVLCSKFIDAMSFYRTEKRLKREGIDIGYSTLCDWPLQLYERLAPFERLFYEALGHCSLWHLDETTLQVLDEPGRDNQKTSYLWSLRSGPPDPPMVLFHYDERRNYEALEQWLRPCLTDFNGAIVTDEHGPYNTLVKEYTNIKAHGGCLAHCRRKFADAAKGRRHSSDAHLVLKQIALIYAQEEKATRHSGAERVHKRQKLVKPQMDKLKVLLDRLAPKYLAKGAMQIAIGYALNNWHKFTAFLEHPELPIDNNPMEQAIRPFTLGRKNWLFAGSPRGARASAFLYSLVESAKANDLEPHRYLCQLFERYPHATCNNERRQLLPWNFKNSD